MQLGESAIAQRPVGQQAGECWEKVEFAATTRGIGIEEGRNHDGSTILFDRLAILGSCTCLEFGQGIAEAFEDLGGIAVIGIANALEGRAKRQGGHGERAALGGGHALVLILNAAGARLGTRRVEVDLQVAQGFQRGTQLQVGGEIGGSRRGDAVVEPSVVAGLVEERVVGQSEGEAESRGHDATGALSEGVANLRHEARERHGILVAVGDAYAAYHHEQTGSGLCRFVPPLTLSGRLGRHVDADGDGVEVLDQDGVLVDHLIFNRIGTALLGLGSDDKTLRLFVVRDLERGVRTQGQLLLEGVLVLGQGFFVLGRFGWVLRVVRLTSIASFTSITSFTRLTGLFVFGGLLGVFGDSLLETVVGFLQEGEMIIERLHVQRTIDVELAAVGDGVTQVETGLGDRTALPVVGGIVAGIGINPIEDGELVQRQLIRRREGLTIVQRRAEVHDAMHDGILPGGIAVGVEILVDGQLAVGLLDFSLCARLEIHVQVLGEVPAQGEVAVPQERLGPRDRQLGSAEIVHVAFLEFVVAASYLGIECNILWQVVDAESLGECHPFRFRLRVLEGLPGLVNRGIGVVERAVPLGVVLVDRRLARIVGVAMAVGEREVGRVVGHGVPLGLHADTDVRQREIDGLRLLDGNRLDGVALVLVHGVECIVEFHIGIERIILRAALLLRDAIIDRCRDVHLVGEELAQLEIGGHGIGLVVVLTALVDALLQSSEALGGDASREVDIADIRQLYVQVARCRPTAIGIDLLQAQLVDPHLAGLDTTRQVAHTNHHRLHLTERRVAENSHEVAVVLVVLAELGGIAGSAQCTSLVAGLLQLGELGEVDVEHVFLRPHGTTVVEIIFIIVVAVGRQFQRDEVFVVVVTIVVTQTDEHCQLVVLQTSHVVDDVVGMNEHLQMLVATQVEGGVMINGLRLTLRDVSDHHAQCLLVSLGELWLRGVGDTRDAGRQHVVDRTAVVVLLDIDSADLKGTAIACSRQWLVVDAPVASYEVE